MYWNDVLTLPASWYLTWEIRWANCGISMWQTKKNASVKTLRSELAFSNYRSRYFTAQM